MIIENWCRLKTPFTSFINFSAFRKGSVFSGGSIGSRTFLWWRNKFIKRANQPYNCTYSIVSFVVKVNKK
jgi:hypothetical protein